MFSLSISCYIRSDACYLKLLNSVHKLSDLILSTCSSILIRILNGSEALIQIKNPHFIIVSVELILVGCKGM